MAGIQYPNNRLKQLRQKQNLSLRALSDKTGIDFATISFCEKGQRNFSAHSLKALADFFGVSTDYLLGISPEVASTQNCQGVGTRVKDLRQRKGWTQQQLAERVGLLDSTVRMWELGKSEPRNETLRLLADLFGVSTDYLLGTLPEGALTRIDMEELQKAALPLIELLREKGNPHMTVSVTDRSVELTEAVMGMPVPYED